MNVEIEKLENQRCFVLKKADHGANYINWAGRVRKDGDPYAKFITQTDAKQFAIEHGLTVV